MIRQGRKIIAVSAQLAHLPASCTVVQGADGWIQALHKPLLHIAGDGPVPADIHHQCIARHFRTSTCTSLLDARNRHDGGSPVFSNIYCPGCREHVTSSDYPMKVQITAAKMRK